MNFSKQHNTDCILIHTKYFHNYRENDWRNYSMYHFDFYLDYINVCVFN